MLAKTGIGFLLRRLLRRKRLPPQSFRPGRITIIESEYKSFQVGPLLAGVLRKPYFDWTGTSDRPKAPDQCVISRNRRYTLKANYDGLTVRVDELFSPMEGEKFECLSRVLKEVVRQKQILYKQSV